MDYLKLRKNNQSEITISRKARGLIVVTSNNPELKKEIKTLINNLLEKGIIILNGPKELDPDNITIVRRRIYSADPRFLRSLIKKFQNLGYEVRYFLDLDKEKKERKKIENEIQRILASLEVDKKGKRMKNAILKALSKMSTEQLVIIREDLKA